MIKMVSKCRSPIVLISVIMLITLLIVTMGENKQGSDNNGHSIAIKKLQLPKIGSDIHVEKINDKLTKNKLKKANEVEELPVYKFSKPDLRKINETAQKFNCDLDNATEEGRGKFLVVSSKNEKRDRVSFLYEKASNVWEFKNITKSNSLKGKNIPTDSTCKKIAEKYIKKLGIHKKRFNNVQVSNEIGYVEKYDQERVVSKQVYFYPEVNNIPVLGISRIIVGIGDNGEIIEVCKYYKDYETYSTEDIISAETALSEIKSKEASIDIEKNMKEANIDKVSLAYWEDPGAISGQPFLQPVWIFEGDGEAADGETIDFYATVPALD